MAVWVIVTWFQGFQVRMTIRLLVTLDTPFVFSAFAEAKKCLNKAHEDSCNFALSTRQAAEFDEDNPFCENGKDPQKSGASWAQVTTLPLFISSFVELFASIPWEQHSLQPIGWNDSNKMHLDATVQFSLFSSLSLWLTFTSTWLLSRTTYVQRRFLYNALISLKHSTFIYTKGLILEPSWKRNFKISVFVIVYSLS